MSTRSDASWLWAFPQEDTSWQAGAPCAQTDPELFFPEPGECPRTAVNMCASCDVREQCLDYAVRHDIRYGVWGGTTKEDRDQMRAGRRTADVQAYCAGCGKLMGRGAWSYCTVECASRTSARKSKERKKAREAA